MIRKYFIYCLVGILCNTTDLIAAELASTIARPGDLASRNPNFVIVHAEILELSSEITSHEFPADARIKIINVLRGRNQTVPREVTAQFNPPLTQAMMIDPRNGNYDLKPEANSAQYDMPEIGSSVLLAYCCLDGNEDEISTQTGIIKWSKQNEATIRSEMAPPEGGSGIGSILFVCIFITTLSGLLLGIINMHEKTKLFLRTSVFSVSFILYFLYESGISSYTNIRIDLLLIYPLLLINIFGISWTFISFYMNFRKTKNA